MRRIAAGLAILGAATVGVAATGARSIFDDDWVPPKTMERPRPQSSAPPPPKPPTAEAPPVAPATPPSTPNRPAVGPAVIPPGEAAAVARRAVPAKGDQAASRRALKEVFADQLVDRSPGARRKLAAALLKHADKSAGAPADQFVLLAAAVDSAVDAADLPLAFDAADRMADGYAVDGLAVKADAAIRLGGRPAPPALAAEDVRAVLELSDALVAADEFQAAVKACAAVQTSVAADPALKGQLQQRQRQVGVARGAAERVAADVAKLKDAPDDPAANASVGRHVCLVKGDWDAGLPMLAKGSDAKLKELARRELERPADANAQYALAGAWWDAAAAERSLAPFAAAARRRAAYWYERAAPGLGGLAKSLADKRVAEAAKESAPAGVGPAADVYTTTKDGKGVELGAAERTIGRDFLIQFDVKTEDGKEKCLLTKRRKDGDSSLSVLTDSEGAVLVADDRSFYRKDLRGATPVNDGRWHTVRIEKEGDSLRLFVDGKADGEMELERSHSFNSKSPWLLGRHGTWGPKWSLDAQFRNLRLEGSK